MASFLKAVSLAGRRGLREAPLRFAAERGRARPPFRPASAKWRPRALGRREDQVLVTHPPAGGAEAGALTLPRWPARFGPCFGRGLWGLRKGPYRLTVSTAGLRESCVWIEAPYRAVS